MTADQLLRDLDEALHHLTVCALPDGDAIEYAVVCSCGDEHIPVSDLQTAHAIVAAGCEVEARQKLSAERRNQRLIRLVEHYSGARLKGAA